MKRKFALMLVFVMITCFGLAGCGDNPTQSDKAETSVSSSQEGDVSSQQEGSSSSQQNGGV